MPNSPIRAGSTPSAVRSAVTAASASNTHSEAGRMVPWFGYGLLPEKLKRSEANPACASA